MITLIGCILIASVTNGPKIVDVRGMRLEATGVGFKVYQCAAPRVKRMVIDSTRPLRVFKAVGL